MNKYKDMLKRTNNNRNQKYNGQRRHNHGQSHRSATAQRHHFQQNFERYLSLAREASSSGDRILAEGYYQHAEHYLRTLNEMKPVELEIPMEEALNESEAATQDIPPAPSRPNRRTALQASSAPVETEETGEAS